MSKLQDLKYFVPIKTKGTKKVRKPKIDYSKMTLLSEDKQRLIILVYDFNQPLNRMADAINCSRQYIHQEYHKAINQIAVSS